MKGRSWKFGESNTWSAWIWQKKHWPRLNSQQTRLNPGTSSCLAIVLTSSVSFGKCETMWLKRPLWRSWSTWVTPGVNIESLHYWLVFIAWISFDQTLFQNIKIQRAKWNMKWNVNEENFLIESFCFSEWNWEPKRPNVRQGPPACSSKRSGTYYSRTLTKEYRKGTREFSIQYWTFSLLQIS